MRLTPRARRDEIGGGTETAGGRCALAIRLAAPPVEGAAKQALVAFLAVRLGLPKSAIEFASGETSRLKTLRLVGASQESLERLMRG